MKRHLEKELEQHAKLLAALINVSNLVTSAMELKPLLESILDQLKTIIDYSGARIFIKEGEILKLVAHRSQLPAEHEENYKFIYSQIPMGHEIILNKKPAILRDIYDDTEEARQFRENLSKFMDNVFSGTRSWIGQPLIFKDKVIGALALDHSIADFYNERHIELGMAFASQVAIQIENARMYQEEKRRHLEDEKHRHVAEGLFDILAILNSNRPLDEILDFIINQAARLMGTDTGALYRYHSDEGMLTVKAACGLPEGFIRRAVIPLGAGAEGTSISEYRPVVVMDIPNAVREFGNLPPEYMPHYKWLIKSCKGLMAVPIVCNEEIYGCIVLYFKETRRFNSDEVELSMMFAYQAALAIDNARLRKQAEKSAVIAERSRLARDLHDAVTQTLFSASLIAEVLPKIWEKNQDEGRKRLDEIRQLTRGALAEMRTLLLELRPATLVEAGLKELLKHLCEATTGRARLPVSLTTEETQLPTDVKIGFYRIAQEALNNVAKHSGANKASVTVTSRMEEGGKVYSLIVSDDGQGFDPQTITGEHLGVKIMRERAESIGAALKVESSRGQGTKIIVDWTDKQEVV